MKETFCLKQKSDYYNENVFNAGNHLYFYNHTNVILFISKLPISIT